MSHCSVDILQHFLVRVCEVVVLSSLGHQQTLVGLYSHFAQAALRNAWLLTAHCRAVVVGRERGVRRQHLNSLRLPLVPVDRVFYQLSVEKLCLNELSYGLQQWLINVK